MRFLHIDLTGYIGIYSPMGLETMSIDFSNSKYPICIVAGPNGMGKSTLLKSLTVFPDSNDRFVPHMIAMKHLVLTNGVNIYEINIVHDLDSHGNRKTPKVSIIKDGAELNPNGNVSSYKEIILNEFGIDTNYTTLCSISGEDQGLSQKTPSERKKILASIISSLNVYNEIYKTLNKKSIILKNQLKSITDKIKSIGNSDNISATLNNINTRLSKIDTLLEDYKSQITRAKTIVDMIDPDNHLQDDINKYTQLKEETLLELKKISYEDSEDIKDLDTYNAIRDNIILSRDNAIDNSNNINVELAKLSERSNYINNRLTEISLKKDKIISTMDDDFENTLEILKKNNSIIEKDLDSLGISNITKTDYDTLISVLDTIMNEIQSIYEDNTIDDISFACSIDDNALTSFSKELSNYKDLKIQISEEYVELAKAINSIKDRPSDCIVDTCPYIYQAISLLKKYDHPEDELKLMEDKLEDLDKEISISKKLVDKTPKLSHIRTRIEAVMNTINANRGLLSKISLTSQLCDIESVRERISNMYSFNEYNNRTRLYDIGNSIITYEKNKEMISKLEINLEANRQKKSDYDDLEKEFNTLSVEKDEISYKFIEYKNKLSIENKVIEESKTLLSKLDTNWNAKQRELELTNQINQYDNSIKDIYNKLSGYSEQMKLITDLQIKVNELESEKIPLNADKQNYDTQYAMLTNFQIEYNSLREEYDYLEKLKNYASPTKGSIQSIYMSMYMDKTLDMANQLLSMIFGGEYRLLDYVITEDEFRIPFIGNGMPVDDISSGSTSQKCIIGMIIDLVLNSIGNSDFGIVTLDEIDGGLDNQNKLLFVDIIQRMRELLNIDQLFVISHSIESTLNNVDVILLSNDQQYLDTFSSANIIWTR